MEKLTLSFFILTTLKKFLPFFLRIILYTSRYWRRRSRRMQYRRGDTMLRKKNSEPAQQPDAQQELLDFENPAVQPGKKVLR